MNEEIKNPKLLLFQNHKDFSNPLWKTWDDVVSDFLSDENHWRLIDKQCEYISDNYRSWLKKDAEKAFDDLYKLQSIGRSFLFLSYGKKIEKIKQKFFGKQSLKVSIEHLGKEPAELDNESVSYFRKKLNSIKTIFKNGKKKN